MIPATSWSLGPHEKRGICLSTLGICGGCGKRPPSGPAKRCSRCKGESYCNANCQRLGWGNGHKKACKVLCGIAVGEKSSLPAVLESLTISHVTKEAIALASVTPSEEKSEELYEKAYDLISGKVGYLSGFEKGQGETLPSGPQDEEEGYLLLRQAADLGHKGAQYNVALAYLDEGYYAEKENGGKADEASLLKWVKLAAENGHAEAQVTYGSKYWYEGKDGHEVDMLQAVTWVRRALAHGVSESEGPDPRGNTLSRRSFEGSVKDAVERGRKLYLEKFPAYMDGDENALECMRTAGDCGMYPAISICFANEENEQVMPKKN